MSLYVNAVDDQLTDRQRAADARDEQTLSVVLCREKNDVLVDYTLRGIESPVGVVTYTTSPAERRFPSREALVGVFKAAEEAATLPGDTQTISPDSLPSRSRRTSVRRTNRRELTAPPPRTGLAGC